MAKRRANGEGPFYFHEERKCWVGRFNLPDGKTKYPICVHINPVLGDVKLTALKANHLQMLYADKLETGLSSRTVRYFHSVPQATLDQALKWGLATKNGANLVEPPKTLRPQPATLMWLPRNRETGKLTDSTCRFICRGYPPNGEQIILRMPGSGKTKTRAADSVLAESVYFVWATSSMVEQLILRQQRGSRATAISRNSAGQST